LSIAVVFVGFACQDDEMTEVVKSLLSLARPS